ncbi:MAG TPA: TrkA family potassium uptake protein [Anaerolineaceae bacterium]
MKVIIVGCGRLGVELATRLYHRKYEITVIDAVPQSFNNLPLDFQGRTNEGDALSRDVLHRAGIEKADALAAVTNQDPLNVVVAHVARVIYRVPNIVVRNYDPHTRSLMEAFGVRLVSSTSWGALRIEEILNQDELHSVFVPGNDGIQVYEYQVSSQWNGKRLANLLLPGSTIPISVSRAGKSIFPDSEMMMETGDIVYFSATTEGYNALRSYLLSLREE